MPIKLRRLACVASHAHRSLLEWAGATHCVDCCLISISPMEKQHFQDGLGIWRVPIHKQAFNEVFTRSSDPLPIVVGFYTAWQRAHSFQHGPVDLPLSHRMRAIRFWNGQGPHTAPIVVGFQSARWRSNISQDGLGTWHVPIRKQAFNEVFTRSSDPLPIAVGFYTAWQRAHSFHHGPIDLPLLHRMRTIRFWNGQGPHTAPIVVGVQSARWRSNIFKTGSGFHLIPAAFEPLTKRPRKGQATGNRL